MYKSTSTKSQVNCHELMGMMSFEVWKQLERDQVCNLMDYDRCELCRIECSEPFVEFQAVLIAICATCCVSTCKV